MRVRPVQTDLQVAELLDGTARAADRGDPDLLREHITHALSTKVLHSLAAQPRFREHVERVLKSTQNRDRQAALTALAELGRLEGYLRPKDHWPLKLATPLLGHDFQPSSSFGSADQRLHIAQIAAASNVEVSSERIAQAALHEKTAEKVRAVWIQMLITRQPLSDALRQITAAIRNSSDKAASSPDSWLRRLHRVLAALDEHLDQSRVEPDGDFIESLRQFVSAALRCSSPPPDQGVSSKTATALFGFARHLVQASVRLGIDHRFYRALAGSRTWFPEGGWLRFTRANGTLRQLRQTLLDGLLLLLEQGKPDPDLIAAHRMLSPDADAAKAELLDLEAHSRHLPSDLRRWLRSSGRHRALAKDMNLTETDDVAIAFAVINATEIHYQAPSSLDALLQELDITAPIQARALRQFAKHAVELADRIQSLANRRGLKIFGAPGDFVEYSPHAYKLASGAAITRRVRIVSPGVEQVGAKTSRVLVHALVEPLDPASPPDY